MFVVVLLIGSENVQIHLAEFQNSVPERLERIEHGDEGFDLTLPDPSVEDGFERFTGLYVFLETILRVFLHCLRDLLHVLVKIRQRTPSTEAPSLWSVCCPRSAFYSR